MVTCADLLSSPMWRLFVHSVKHCHWHCSLEAEGHQLSLKSLVGHRLGGVHVHR